MKIRPLPLFSLMLGASLISLRTSAQEAPALPPEENPYDTEEPASAAPEPSNPSADAAHRPEFVSYAASPSDAPSDPAHEGELEIPPGCNPYAAIPITGQLGPDGAWHLNRSPVVVGGGPGPCTPRRRVVVAQAPSSAPPDVDVEDRSSQAPTPQPPFVAEDGTQSSAAPHTVRGGGPVAGEDLMALPPPPPQTLTPTSSALLVRPRERLVRFVLGAGGGTGMFTTSTNGADLGGAWHFAMGVEFARTLSFEARYHGSANLVPIAMATANYGLITNGIDGMVRLAIPIPYVRPFAHGGLGSVWFTPYGPDAASAQNASPVRLNAVPVGGGLEIRPIRSFAIDFEYTYRFLIDNNWVLDHTAHPWGDLWDASASLRLYL